MLWHATCIFGVYCGTTTLHFLRVCSIQVGIMAFHIPCFLLLPYLAVEKDILCLHIWQASNLRFTEEILKDIGQNVFL